MQATAASSPAVTAATATADAWSSWRRARLLQLQSLSADELRSLLLREEERWLRLQSPIPPVDPMEDDDAAAASLAAFAAAFAPASAPAAASSGIAAAPTAAPASAFAATTHTQADHDADLAVEASRTHAHYTQNDTRVSPAMRVYRHALESVFSMLKLHDLTQILAVSRSWSAAVRSMKPIGATIERDEEQLKRQGKVFRPLPPIDRLVASSLIRHLAGLHVRARADDSFNFTSFTSETFALLVQRAPNLTSLWCSDLTLPLTPPHQIWPAKLTSLRLQLWLSADELNRMLTTLAALHFLQRLMLCSVTMRGVDLSLLAASPSLRDLTLEDLNGRCPQFSDRQVAQIRSDLGQLQRVSFGIFDHADLARLLQSPHALRWQDIGAVIADARIIGPLSTLPTLTRVNLDFGDAVPHVYFLTKLPLLSALRLSCNPHIPTAPLLAPLLPCIGLTELELQCALYSAQVGALLSALTNLRKLTLRQVRLDSLRCFTSGAATVPRTLEALYLNQLNYILPPSEIVHLHALQGLRSLELFSVFLSLDESALASLTPPTASLPRLTRFVHIPAGFGQSFADRAGPSFEWMQQRLTR